MALMTDDTHTLIPLPVWFVLVVTLLFGCPSTAYSEPLFRVSHEGVVITLHNEKCEMKEVSNLPHFATWEEKGKSFKGCWGFNPLGVVMLYFSDKTIAVVPASAFTKVQGV
jgi:hypothetical protein